MGKTGHLLDRQFKRMDVDRELLRRFDEAEEKAGPKPPVITISRQFGSGGRIVGQLVANELKFSYYDRQIIEEVAETTRTDEQHIADHEAHPRDPVTGLLTNLLDPRSITDTVYLRHLLRVFAHLERQSRAVIIGRGGCCALRSSVKVRIVAPFDIRVARMADIRGLKQEEAERTVLAADHGQCRFLRSYFACHPDDPLVYDLVLNTETLSLEHTAELIIARVRQIWKEGRPA